MRIRIIGPVPILGSNHNWKKNQSICRRSETSQRLCVVTVIDLEGSVPDNHEGKAPFWPNSETVMARTIFCELCWID